MKNVLEKVANISRFLFVLFVLASAFVFAMFQGGQVSWTIFYAVVPFVLYSVALFFYPMRNIKVERFIKTAVVEHGGTLSVKVNIKRKWRFPLLYAVVSERWNGKKRRSKLFVIGFQKQLTWSYDIEHLTRGEYTVGGVTIELTDFFGWIRKSHFFSVRNSVLVYPETTKLYYVPFETEADDGLLTSPFDLIKDTTLATGLRDFQTGDRMSWIHWKSFARTEKLMTKEFEEKYTQQFTIVLDGRQSEVFEEQVSLVASLLQEAFTQHAEMNLLVLGKEPMLLNDIQTATKFNEARIHLAKIKPAEITLKGMPEVYGRTIQQSGQIILVSGNPDWAYMQSVAKYVPNSRRIICFVCVKNSFTDRTEVASNIKSVRAKGIAVHSFTKSTFSEALKEVRRS